LLKGLETAYSWEQEEEGGEAVKERGVPGGQEPEQDQEDEEEWSRQTRYSRQGSIIIFFFAEKMSQTVLLDPGIDLGSLKGKCKKDVFFMNRDYFLLKNNVFYIPRFHMTKWFPFEMIFVKYFKTQISLKCLI